MAHKVRLGTAMVLGSFFLYCAQDVTQSSPDAEGPVAEVGAQDAGTTGGDVPATPDDPDQIVVATCCPPPARAETEVLFDGVVPAGAAGEVVQMSDIDISAFRSVVLHANGCGWYSVDYRFGDAAGFVGGPEAGVSLAGSNNACDAKNQLIARIDPELGDEARLKFQFQQVFDGPEGVAVTVVGRR